MTYDDVRRELREAAETAVPPQWKKVAELSLSTKSRLRNEPDDVPETVLHHLDDFDIRHHAYADSQRRDLRARPGPMRCRGRI